MNKLQIYKSERFGTIRTDVDEKGKPLHNGKIDLEASVYCYDCSTERK